MKYVTLKELRWHTRQILEQAGSGEQIAITFRGKPVALLVPFDEEGERKVRPAYAKVEEALKAGKRRP